MNLNRRKFFRVVAAGAAAASIPTFLRPDKVQGKIYTPEPRWGSLRPGFYGWSEQGAAVLDNRRVLLGEFDIDPEAAELLKEGAIQDEAPLWNIAKGRDYTKDELEELARALETPLRKGVMSGDITDKIFERVELQEGAKVEFPLDFLAPGTEKDFVAYTIPNCGRIPERAIQGDPVKIEIPTYDIDAESAAKAMDEIARIRGVNLPGKVHDEFEHIDPEMMEQIVEGFAPIPEEKKFSVKQPYNYLKDKWSGKDQS